MADVRAQKTHCTLHGVLGGTGNYRLTGIAVSLNSAEKLDGFAADEPRAVGRRIAIGTGGDPAEDRVEPEGSPGGQL
jgi:hypothetical protein